MLSRIGLFERGAFLLGLNEVRPTDVFVVSYPKSGNTWVRFLLANMLYGDEEITFRNINQIVPGVHNFTEQINNMPGERYIKAHEPIFDFYPRMIYVYRDYRDVLVSYYYFEVSQGNFSGGIGEFVRKVQLEKMFDGWVRHVNGALAMKQEYPELVLMLSYEDLLNQPLKGAQEIERFCGIRSARPLEEVVEICGFSSLQENEKTHGNVAQDPTRQFFRKGTSEQWREELDEATLSVIMEEEGVKELLAKLGYPTE